MIARAANEPEIDHLARLWQASWNDAHSKLEPAGLVKARTLESFRERLAAALADTRVVGPAGAPPGLCMIKDDELYQLFVAREARGTGVAAALLADGESRIADRDVTTAWLACVIGNDRAARFYEKHGWRRARTMMSAAETADGVFEREVWRYEKQVGRTCQGTPIRLRQKGTT
jgi:GNAT superfamily N-acetyltransferase